MHDYSPVHHLLKRVFGWAIVPLTLLAIVMISILMWDSPNETQVTGEVLESTDGALMVSYEDTVTEINWGETDLDINDYQEGEQFPLYLNDLGEGKLLPNGQYLYGKSVAGGMLGGHIFGSVFIGLFAIVISGTVAATIFDTTKPMKREELRRLFSTNTTKRAITKSITTRDLQDDLLDSRALLVEHGSQELLKAFDQDVQKLLEFGNSPQSAMALREMANRTVLALHDPPTATEDLVYIQIITEIQERKELLLEARNQARAELKQTEDEAIAKYNRENLPEARRY